jgi:DNA-binding XRE family transcriptional regulator
MFKTNIVDLVKGLRKETGVSQEELANYIWVSRLTYISVENWKREFKENEVCKIADFFEKPISDFLNEKENKEDPKRKLKNLILYIAYKYKDKENFWKTMLNKLLYFSDFNYYEWTWSLITGVNYKKLPYWPVPEDIREVLNEMVIDWEVVMKDEKIWDFVIQKIIPLDNSDIQFFNNVDLINKQKRENYTPYDDLPWSKQIVDDVLVKYEKWTTRSLSDLSHEDTPYKAIKNYWDVIKPIHVFYRSKSFIVNHHNL